MQSTSSWRRLRLVAEFLARQSFRDGGNSATCDNATIRYEETIAAVSERKVNLPRLTIEISFASSISLSSHPPSGPIKSPISFCLATSLFSLNGTPVASNKKFESLSKIIKSVIFFQIPNLKSYFVFKYS